MQTVARPAGPLPRLAGAVPAAAARWTSIVARVIGAGASVGYAIDQSYDRTQVVTVVVAVVVMLSLLPTGRATPWLTPFGGWLSALGAGTLLFAGAVLVHEPLGIVMLLAGLVACAATAVVNHARRVHPLWTTAGVLMSSGLIVLIAVTVALAVVG